MLGSVLERHGDDRGVVSDSVLDAVYMYWGVYSNVKLKW
jgi:hypothetical protein